MLKVRVDDVVARVEGVGVGHLTLLLRRDRRRPLRDERAALRARLSAASAVRQGPVIPTVVAPCADCALPM